MLESVAEIVMANVPPAVGVPLMVPPTGSSKPGRQDAAGDRIAGVRGRAAAGGDFLVIGDTDLAGRKA